MRRNTRCHGMRHGLGRVLAVSAALLSPLGLLFVATVAPGLAVGLLAVGVAAGVARLRDGPPRLRSRRSRPSCDAAGVGFGCGC